MVTRTMILRGVLAAAAISLLCGANCGQRGNDAWTGYDENFNLDSTWDIGVSLEGKHARPFDLIQLARVGNTIDGWRTTGTIEGTTHEDVQLSFVVDWGGGNRVTLAGKVTPNLTGGDPNNRIDGRYIEFEENGILQEGPWLGARRKSGGRFKISGSFAGEALALDTDQGYGETRYAHVKVSDVGVTHVDLERRIELMIQVRDDPSTAPGDELPAGEYEVVAGERAEGQLGATLRVDHERAPTSPDAVAAVSGTIKIDRYHEGGDQTLTGSAELNFPGGDRITTSFTEIPSR